MKFAFACLILLLSFAAGSPLHAQSIHTFSVGSEFETKVKFARSELPLPPGRWKLIANGEEFGIALSGAQRPRLAFAHLAQLEDNRLVALVSFFGTQQYDGTAWARDADCDRTDFVLALADKNFNAQDQWCLNVQHRFRTWVSDDNMATRTKALYTALNDAKIVRPPLMLETKVRVVRSGEFVDATYLILPTAFGGPVTKGFVFPTSEWHVQNIANHPQHREFADGWIAWSKPMLEVVRAGFGRTLADYSPAPYPFAAAQKAPAAPATSTASVAAPAAPARAAAPQTAAASVLKAGTRFATASGEFRVERIDGSIVHMVNKANQSSTWFPRGLMPFDSASKFDRQAAEALFPMKIGNKVTFEQQAASGDNAWRHTLEVVRAEVLTIEESKYPTWIVEVRTESLNPGQGGFVRKRTVWFAPQLGWILRMREEQLAGPPQTMNSWDVVRIVPPG